MRASAPANRIPDQHAPKRVRRWRTTARPLAVQRLAAELVARTLGLDRAHIGTICDALTTAGIDPTVWTARAVTDALEADMRTRGGTWPDHIANPGAFLHSRLRRLSWAAPQPTPPQPTTAGGSAAASSDQAPPPVVLTDASRARIAAAQQEIRRVLRDHAQHSATTRSRAYVAVPHPNATTAPRRDTSTAFSLTTHRDAPRQRLADLKTFGLQAKTRH